MALLHDVVKDMNAKGIDQWHEGYPNREVVSKDMLQGTLYCLLAGDSLVGVITINTTYDTEYDEMNWLTPEGRSLFVHRLAVQPAHQKQGLATMLMAFAEEKALNEKYLSVRLDTYTKNPGNMYLYQKLGYTTIGQLNLPYRPAPFVCYEKLVG